MRTIELETLPTDVMIGVIKALDGKISTKQLADKIGVGYVTISAVESRRKKAGHKLLSLLANTYNLDINILLQSAHEFNQSIKN